MSNIFIEYCRFIIQIYCSMFRLHRVARKRKSIRIYEKTQTDPSSSTDISIQLLTDNWLNSLIFIYLNSRYRLCDVISQSYCVISHVSPNSRFSFSHVTRHESILFTFRLHVWSLVYSIELSNLIYISAQILYLTKQLTEKLGAQPNQIIKSLIQSAI